MKKGGGKQKGAEFERWACRALSEWVTGGEQVDVFWRSAMSGGRATVHRAKGKKLAAQAGDITCVSPIGQRFTDKFLCECKFYNSLNYAGLLTGVGTLVEFWKTLQKESRYYNKLPFLIAKQNRMAATISMTRIGASEIKLGWEDAALICPSLDMWVVDASKFLTTCKPYRNE